ncbi:MAG: hypothetical protein LC795_15490 [Acidobacteria bacterium]|nr:hypothetical protein [Acidobacteriota bacterium]MCA1620679.1 hypothetical protein [Acidobacteriota bacterium]
MIPTNLISDQQFLRARELALPVRVAGPASFVLPSATRPELTRHHLVTFDSATQPREFSCTCEAYLFGNVCWAAARALDVLVKLAVIGVSFDEPVTEAGAGMAVPAPAVSPRPARPAPWDGRLVCKRTHRAPEPEGNAEAVLVAPIRRVSRVEKVRGFTI